ncbi:MAG: hypothetical protein GY723_15190 [bacterium]|nr:hypothetical protein [bacterium]
MLDWDADSRGARIVIAAALMLAVMVLYAPVSEHSFLNYDDDLLLTQNPNLPQGLSSDGVAWAMTTTFGGNWFPLTWLSYLAEQDLHGLSSRGVHNLNAVLHALATALLFAALVRLTGSTWRSAMVAGIFAVHPLNVESVAWAAQRRTLLAGVFSMGCLWLHAGRRERPSVGSQVSLFLCFGLAVMSKPSVVTLPFVLLLLDYWPLQRLGGVGRTAFDYRAVTHALVEKLPLFALVVGLSVVTFIAQRDAGAVISEKVLSFDVRGANALISYLGYVLRFFWPVNLAVFYPHPETGFDTDALAAGAVLAAASACALVWMRGRPYLAVGWFWFVGTLVPTIGLVQVGSQSLADRYTYLPMIGLAIALVWSLPERVTRSSATRTALAAGSLAVLLALALATRVQLTHWRDSNALFEHALSVTERNLVAHEKLSAALLVQGRKREGVAHLRQALEIQPRYLHALNNLAWALATDRDLARSHAPESVRLARRAVQLAPGDAMVLDTLATAYAADGRYGQALRTSDDALALVDPRAQPAVYQALSARRELFRAGRPYREGGP